MKKIIPLIAFSFFFVSCDLIMKKHDSEDEVVVNPKQMVLGTDKDEHGCVGSAGYRWSILKKDCIRVFEGGFRMNPVKETPVDTEEEIEEPIISSFVTFEKDGDRAELFLPEKKESVIMTREKEGKPYHGGEWTLETDGGLSLKVNGVMKYKGALTEEKAVTGSDNPEQ